MKVASILIAVLAALPVTRLSAVPPASVDAILRPNDLQSQLDEIREHIQNKEAPPETARCRAAGSKEVYLRYSRAYLTRSDLACEVPAPTPAAATVAPAIPAAPAVSISSSAPSSPSGNVIKCSVGSEPAK